MNFPGAEPPNTTSIVRDMCIRSRAGACFGASADRLCTLLPALPQLYFHIDASVIRVSKLLQAGRKHTLPLNTKDFQKPC